MSDIVTPPTASAPAPVQPASAPAPQQKKPLTELGMFFQNNRWAIWLIAFAAVAFAILAYFIFVSHGTPTPKIAISIEAPEKLASGLEVVYKVHFSNNDKSTISGIVIDMLYPQGFSYVDSVPKPSVLNGSQFTINQLNPGENGVIMVKGTLVGNSGDSKSIGAIMHYSYSNFRSTFVAHAENSTSIISSNIVLQFDGQSSSNNDQSLTYTLKYTNSSSRQLANVHINLNLPAAFKVQNFSPLPTVGNEWDLANLDVGGTGQIQLTGSFIAATIGDKAVFSADASGPDSNGQTVTLSSANYPVSIIALPLETVLSGTGNNSSTLSGVVQPGDELDFHIQYRNNASIPLNGVVVKAYIDGAAADLTSVKAVNAVVKDNVVSWDASQVNDFNTLAPNQTGDLEFRFKLKNPASKSNDKNLVVASHTVISSAEYQQGFASQSINEKVQTVASMSTALQYLSGAQPLKVGQTTQYAATISLRNATNDIANGVVTFNLPRADSFDVSLVNKAEQKNIRYDPNTHRITWNVGTLQAHSGDFNSLRTLQLIVPVTPFNSEVGGVMLILNHISFEGTDSFTASPISLSTGDLTTQDDMTGNGSVVP